MAPRESRRASNNTSGQSKQNARIATPIAADCKGLDNVSLDELRSKNYRKVLGVIDSLRSSGLGAILQLPQLVVCGDQSSGKSSGLEEITEVPFSRKENLCTRYATKIILRRSQDATITTRIIPDQARPDAEKKSLLAFKKTRRDFSQLPALMDRATTTMGLADGKGSLGVHGNKAFTRDVLTIEISGSDRP